MQNLQPDESSGHRAAKTDAARDTAAAGGRAQRRWLKTRYIPSVDLA